MVNYGNGKIYKIEDLAGEMCYIGSTTKDYLSKRMVQHRAMYKHWLKEEGVSNYSVFRIFEKYGVNGCRIVLVELCPCDSRDELLKREVHYVRASDCVNKYIPSRTNKQYVKDKEEKIRIHKKQYNGSHAEDKKIKAICICGSTFRKTDTNRHERTTKHINYLANQAIDI
jgi:hypothetical protein